jgi:rhamnosyltransferase
MRRLVVMAHYDADGELAPHVRRQVEAWGGVADRVLLVSTADVARGGPDEKWLAQQAGPVELIRRPNLGYDFGSWQVGLSLVEDLDRYDLVVICNDSCVGPLVPYATILDEMDRRPVDFWGITQTRRRGRHVQSYFVGFRGRVVRSPSFRGFWRTMEPISDRSEVITRYELGLSTTLFDAGFRAGTYYSESRSDRRLARARHLWWAAQTIRQLPAHRRARALRQLPLEPWNPMSALADRALDHARLPLVKIDTLRYDPYGLDAERLLRACERRYPEEFDGVRAYLERTAARYPARPGERSGPARPPAVVRQLVGYRR